MSTKWNNHQRLQKTPKVCKKGPADLPLHLRNFHNYPLQAYASWFDPSGTTQHDIRGTTVLAADRHAITHDGWIHGNVDKLHLTLDWDYFYHLFTYTISLYEYDILQKSVQKTFIQPPPNLPWIAGMFTWHHYATNEHIESKIYS